MSIYKACDIRGRAETELSSALYYAWGRALGGRLPVGAEFVVGGDVRHSTPAFLGALANGLAEAGMQVLQLGIVPTPMVYFVQRHRQAAGCAIVTASHSPPPINGLKWMVGTTPPDEAEVQSLKVESATSAAPRAGGRLLSMDAQPGYVDWLKRRFALSRPWDDRVVVLDPGNGAWSRRAIDICKTLFPALRFHAIHDRPDGAFADRDPDCALPEHLAPLGSAVVHKNAALGIAFDGDGDRVAFVDEAGHPLSAEEATWVLLHSVAGQLAGNRFVYDVKFSDQIPRTAESFGAQALAERSGHAFLRRRMRAEQACFGAEISGHYFYGELEGGDDGLFTACHLLTWLATQEEPMSVWRRRVPPIHMSPDLRLALAGSAAEDLLDVVRRSFAEFPQSYVDGVRITFPEGWALVRRSVTEAKVTFRFEGASREALTTVVDRFCARIGVPGGELARQFARRRPTP